MTDKQVIIDDVDVSKCDYFNNTDNSYCEECCSEFGCAICNDRPNCYYKQLKRKEQECERLKEEVSLLKESNSKLQQIEDINSLEKCYLQQIDQLKAENKQLKAEKVKYYQQTLDDEIQINELLQTLTEIKEIADEQIPYLDIDKAKTITEVEYDYAGKIYNLEQRMYKILQKISEVEDEKVQHKLS